MIELQGSHKTHVAGAVVVNACHPDEQVGITLLLRRKLAAGVPAAARVPRQDWYLQYGADPDEVSAVCAHLREQGIGVTDVDFSRRTVHASGTVAAMEATFGVQLHHMQLPQGGTHRGRLGAILLHADIHHLIDGVFGLDNRPVAKPHFRVRRRIDERLTYHASQGSFTPAQLANIYQFPSGFDGTGQTIGIISLGGGLAAASDYQTYFQSIGVKTPQITLVLVDGAQNKPDGPNGADGENALDIDCAGGSAPGAHIVVYLGPNTDQGFIDTFSFAIHDKKHQPTVISCSWGGREDTYTSQSQSAMNGYFADAKALGVTLLAAAGDDGSTDGGQGNGVDFPASSPWALACGGTKLTVDGNGWSLETVWNEMAAGEGATGGGVSSIFPVPDYQQDLALPGIRRCVPDWASVADPTTGVQVRVDGQNMVIGGTSAAAPLLAGLIARLNQALGKNLGYFHPQLYSLPTDAFYDITQGNNGGYAAGVGYDCCTGLGRPVGARILKYLQGPTVPPPVVQPPPVTNPPTSPPTTPPPAWVDWGSLEKLLQELLQLMQGMVPAGKPKVERSGSWPSLRKAWLENHPTCAACGGTEDLEVHHKIPVSWDASKELDEKNLLVLCEHPSRNCHYVVGHGGRSWSCYNPHSGLTATWMLDWMRKIKCPE